MDLELRLLRSFVAIYEEGTLSRAAEQLHCTQAAMSMRLKLIETELGEMLFRRRHHRLEPTSKAAELYARAVGVLAAYDEMMSATRSPKPRQRLRLGVPDDYALGILPRALSRLGLESGIEVEIVCDLSANLAAGVQHQQLDLALVTLASRPPGCIFEAELRLCWIMAPGALLSSAAALPLAAYPEGCVFRRAMIETLERVHRPWYVQTQSRTHAGIIAAVRAGLAVSSMAAGTVPADLAECRDADGLFVLPTVPVYLLSQSDTPLGSLLQEEVSALAGPGASRRVASGRR